MASRIVYKGPLRSSLGPGSWSSTRCAPRRWVSNAGTRMIASVADDRTVELTAAIPMGRYTGPRETAAAVPFLASEEAGYFTDAILPVDGGLSI